MENTPLTEGMDLPSFELATDGEGTFNSEQAKGSKLVLYFYPKDDTPGCTKEALAFSELADEFIKAGARIVGVSPDTALKHDKFKAKHGINVTLASDPDKELSQTMGVWVEKNMYGKKYWGVERSTFLMDESGKIVKIWRKVKVPGHAEAVLNAVKEL